MQEGTEPPQSASEVTGASEPARRLIEIPPLTEEKAAFQEAIIGQEDAVDSFATLLARLKSGIRSVKPQPLDAKFLAGPSGVGKTEIVYRLAEVLSGNAKDARSKVIKINGGEYQEKWAVSRLLGSAPGFIGSEDPRWPGGTPPVFSQDNLDNHRIFYTDSNGKQKDVVIILVDEADKVDNAVHKTFLSILDKASLDLANNKSADFRNAIILFTSSVGSLQMEQLRDMAQGETTSQDIPEAFREAAGEALVGQEAKETINEAFKAAFPPEFRGRIKDLVIFKHLTPEAIERIINLRVREVEQDFLANGIPLNLKLSPSAHQWLIKRGYNPAEGARALDKVIADSVRIPLTLAQTGVGLSGKTIYADFEEGSEGLQLYIPETATSKWTDLPQDAYLRLTEALVSGGTGRVQISIQNYKKERAKLVEEGVIASPDMANRDPGIQAMIVGGIEYRLGQGDIVGLRFFFAVAYDADLITKELLEKPEIKEAARKQLKKLVDSRQPVVLGGYTDLFMLAGIGTAEEWEKSIGPSGWGILTVL